MSPPQIAIPMLETCRLLLRPLRIEDAQDMLEYARDSEIAGLGLWPPLRTIEECVADLAEAIESCARGETWAWALEHKASRRMIGRCDLLHYSPRNARAELGYAMNRRYWGHGYMTEAAEAVVAFGFEYLRLHRIEAICLPENAASLRVLEKLGMRREGTKREATFVRGVFDDLHMYALLRQEWRDRDSSA